MIGPLILNNTDFHKFINRQIEELLEGGIVKPSQSPYNTPIWIIPKKENSKRNKCWRMLEKLRFSILE